MICCWKSQDCEVIRRARNWQELVRRIARNRAGWNVARNPVWSLGSSVQGIRAVRDAVRNSATGSENASHYVATKCLALPAPSTCKPRRAPYRGDNEAIADISIGVSVVQRWIARIKVTQVSDTIRATASLGESGAEVIERVSPGVVCDE